MVSLRKALDHDYDFYYSLKCEHSAVYWGGFSEPPAYDGLRCFWENLIAGSVENREILIMENNGVPVGYVQSVRDGDALELSMGITEREQGRGFGTEIIRRALSYYHKQRRFIAYIRRDNIASTRCFLANGFSLSTDGSIREVFFPLDGRYFCMEKYELIRSP